jgi:hypothetical protein
MGVIDDMFMKPSETGKDSVTLDELGSLIPSDTGPKDKYGRPAPQGDKWGDYLKMMQYLTQPRTDAGPEARRAMGGLPTGPQNIQDPVQLQSPGVGSSLMALLFGGMK